jgi:hypothetical protein
MNGSSGEDFAEVIRKGASHKVRYKYRESWCKVQKFQKNLLLDGEERE